MTGTSPADPADARRVERRNFLLNSVEGALFIASGAFINPQTVLPALISRLGGNNIVIGALGVLVYVGLFLPQIFSARYVDTLPWKKRWVLKIGATHRSLVLVMGVIVLLFGASRPGFALWLFLGVFTLMQVIIGVATPGWFEMFAKLTPARKRGRLVGVRNSLGGAAAFLCGFVLTWLLAVYPFSLNFALGFFAAFLLQTSSLTTQLWLIESEPSVTSARRPISAFLKELPRVFHDNPPFRNFIVSSALLTVAAMPVGFFTVYALKRFHADESVVGEFTLTMVAVQVVSALVNGYIADKRGNKSVLVVAAGALLLATLTALLAPTLAWFRLVYLFLGINLGTEIMARYNMSIEYGSARHRSTYIGLMNTALAPFYLSGLIGGAVSEWLGFGYVFALGALFSVAGLVYLVARVVEPRSLHVTAVRG